MASNTPNLDLYKKDPVADGNDTFNIQTMMNDNWDKIDADKAEQDAAIQEQGTTLVAHLADTAKHIIICTSTTRPSNPPKGQHIFETDTNNTMKNIGTPSDPIWVWYYKSTAKGSQTFTTSTTWVTPDNVYSIDIFVVGGGGGGGNAGGGGGCAVTRKGITTNPGESWIITIGAGGAGGRGASSPSDAANGKTGGTTTVASNATSVSANGGVGANSGSSYYSVNGGNGGSGGGTHSGGNGGSNGANGTGSTPGTGQGTSTRAFGEITETLYAGGGGGDVGGIGGAGGGANGSASSNTQGSSAAANTGGGGGGGKDSNNYAWGGSGGSGIAIIRWGY